MFRPFKQSDPRPEFREVFFTCFDQNDVKVPLQSSDMSSFVVYLTKNTAAAGLITPTITQVDPTNNKGLFRLDMTAAHIDTAGSAALVISNTGGTKTMLRRELWFNVDQAFFITVTTTVAPTVSAFSSNRTEANSFWKDGVIIGRTGANAGQVKKVGAYANTNGLFTLATINAVQLAFSSAPANGDVFEVLTQ